MKYILELLKTLFCENVSVNKIMMRLVKLACKRLIRLITSYDMVP